jgi:threonine aldolase
MAHRSFASDNNASVHPEILSALTRVNEGHVVAYGDDPVTERAVAKFREAFGPSSRSFFVFNGTAANVLSLKALTQPYHAVICARSAHIQNDECGAPERFLGCKLIPVATSDGKLRPADIEENLKGIGDQHHVQAKVVSIAQTTEYGTLYSLAELKALSDCAHRHGLYLHVDGARFSNAAAALGVTLGELSRGIDVLSFGGTKNGLVCGESVVFFDEALAEGFLFHRKQAMQLSSKMRYISAQFEAFLTDDLWLRNARHANEMAALLGSRLKGVGKIRITQDIQANALFVRVPPPVIDALRKKYFFYVFDDTPDESGRLEVRWMCSFDTTKEDVETFAAEVSRLCTSA